jgi:hypothetical protein
MWTETDMISRLCVHVIYFAQIINYNICEVRFDFQLIRPCNKKVRRCDIVSGGIVTEIDNLVKLFL